MADVKAPKEKKPLVIELTEAAKKETNVVGSFLDNKAKPLGELNPNELLKLAIIAAESQSPRFLGLFKTLPKLEDLQAVAVDEAFDKATEEEVK